MANASVKKEISKKSSVKVKGKPTAALLTTIKNTVQSVQTGIGVYAFFNTLFWLAYAAKFANKSGGLYLIFKPAWSFVNLFYTYKPIKGQDDIDFTGIVCTVCLIVIIIILKSIYDYLVELEEAAKIELAKRLERAKKRAMTITKINKREENVEKSKDAGFIFLLDIDIKQVAGFIQANTLSPEEIAKIKSRFYTSLLNNLNLNQVSQKGYYKKKLFLNYKSISSFDDFVFYTRETLNSLSKEFTNPTIRIDFLVGLNIINTGDDIRETIDVIDTINKLGLKNEFICTQSLKDIYETLPKQSFVFISKGVYNLSKNLNVSNNQEIFSIREGQ